METHRLALTPGYQIEHFRIESILGKGGFGITYMAVDLQLGKKVAIKELLPDSIATRIDGSTVVPHSESQRESWEWARERFLDEARVLAGFSHPSIVGVHRLIEANGTVYMVMDYVDGESYEARLRRIGREPDQAALMAVIGPILDGLSEVHAKNLLHRDIKPENILIDRRGQPVLIDFGSARMAVGATMTMTSIVTHGYSPAEQYQTKGKMGPWTDIYALGAVMCRAITGEKPTVASDRIMEDDFLWLSHRGLTGFDEKFLAAVDWALRVRPEERPQHIVEWEPHLISSPGFSPSVELAASDETRVALPAADLLESKSAQPKKRRNQSVVVAVIIAIALIGSFFAAVYVGHVNESARKAAAEEEAAQKAQERTAAEVALAREQAEKVAEAARAAAIKEAELVKTDAWKKATKESPYENSLGMKFVPVAGTDVLFSIWDTRVKDYAVFAEETGTDIVRPSFAQTPTDPVVLVSWEEAQAFCKWLTEKERSEGKIGKNDTYRLPTDAEWSVAVGTTQFPWGDEWPPPKGVGNYDPSLRVDTFVNTSPVGWLTANRFGLYDMGGNVWQWCEDWYRASMDKRALLEKILGLKDDGGGQRYRVVRGASWNNFAPEILWSSSRSFDPPDYRNSNLGFRCVLGSSR